MQENTHGTAFNVKAAPQPQDTEQVWPLIVVMAEDGDLDGLKRIANLIESGGIETDVNVTGPDGNNALHVLAQQCRDDGATGELASDFTAMVSTLTQMGVDPAQTNYDGLTPAEIANNKSFSAAMGIGAFEPAAKPGGRVPRHDA